MVCDYDTAYVSTFQRLKSRVTVACCISFRTAFNKFVSASLRCYERNSENGRFSTNLSDCLELTSS